MPFILSNGYVFFFFRRVDLTSHKILFLHIPDSLSRVSFVFCFLGERGNAHHDSVPAWKHTIEWLAWH